MNRGPHPDELISGAVSGELSPEERGWLDEHLAGCPRCQDIFDEWSGQRRLLGGMRREAAPPTLASRVQHGIATGRGAEIPWWRRPRGLAMLGAAAMLVLLVGTAVGLAVRGPGDPTLVGASQTQTATASTASASPIVTAPPPPPAATATLAATQAPTTAPTAAATPAPPVPTPAPTAAPVATHLPAAYFSWSRADDGSETLEIVRPTTGEAIATPESTGAVVAAALAPDREWVAYISMNGLSGVNELYAYHLATDPDERVTVPLGSSVAGTPFLERLAWSPQGRFVAYTLMDPETGGVDAWLLDTEGDLVPRQITDTGDAYAAAFDPAFTDENDLRLWISRAGNTATTEAYVVAPGVVESADDGVVWEDVFLPLPNADGSRTLLWRGSMAESDAQWTFRRDGMPYLTGPLAEYDSEDDATQVFTTLPAEGDGFGYAAFDWSPDGVTFAVWNTFWTGEGSDGEFPDQSRVYMTTADDPELITPAHALDRDDIPPDTSVRHVSLAADGRHLALTLQGPVGGDMDDPAAELRVVTRNLGTTPDEVEVLGEPGRWNGPGMYRPNDPNDS